MIEYFNELIVGAFENKIQAFSHPSKYAFIRVTHRDVGNGLFYGEQAYNYQLNKPYRQFVLEPIEEDGKIRIINYEILDQHLYVNFKNLNTLNKSKLKIRSGCDVFLELKENSFVGGLQGCDCKVEWRGRDTYLQNEIELTPTHYYVKDLGFCAIHKHQIWGSKHGRFEFARMPL